MDDAAHTELSKPNLDAKTLICGHPDYIVGIKDWFRKKVKRPVTDSIETVSKTSYKKDKPKQKLSEDRTIISRQGTPETTTTATTKVEQEEVVRLKPTDNELQTLDKTHKIEATKPASLQRLSPEAIPKYSRILVPHDGSEISDKALAHAIYQSKISGAEIVILNVVEHIESKESSTVTATAKGEEEGVEFDRTKRADLEITVEGEAKRMIEDKIRLCKEAGVTSQISYKIQTGKPVDEIVKLAEEINVDLIVMASSRITSSVMVLGSTTRRVMDGTKKPVLVIL
jgi:nucleotide-binding universal stress UspA family protein